MKKNHLSLLLFFLALNTYAQSDFQDNLICGRDTTIAGAKKFQSVDIDGDGDNDLLSVSEDDVNVGWFENLDGEGSYGTYKILVSDGGFPYVNAFVSDIDGDGDLDLLAILKFSESVEWYENIDGQGNYSEKQQVSANLGFGLDAVYAIDIDGDNDKDVFYSGPNTLGWTENLDGLGTFGPKQYIYTSRDVSSLVFADFDNDLDLDLLFIKDSNIIWLENLDGQGSFGSDQILTTEVDEPKSVYAADLDNDGFIDIMSASSEDGKIAWYKNTDGIGNFGSQTVISVMESAVSIDAGDLDNDNDMDIAVIINDPTNGFSFIRLFENLDSLGNFGNMETVAFTDYSTTLLLSDVDGDSYLDIITNEDTFTGYRFDELNWFKNNSQLNNFGTKQRVIGNVRGYGASTAFDIDIDGDLDVLAVSGGLLAYHENIDGQFGPQKVIWTMNNSSDVTTADIDNDGDLDILFCTNPASNWQGRVGWFENLDGFGNFGNVRDIATGNYFGSEFVLARDIDNDGDLDVIESNGWYENTDGLGDFVNKYPGGYPADIDGDNDLDLVSDQYVHKNVDGLGNFELHQVLDNITAIGIAHTELIDIDTDGDIDIFIASSGALYWYENLDGLGNYGPKLNLVDIDNVQLAKHIDLDGDGDLDIVASSKPTNDFKLEWFEKINGTNTYEAARLIGNPNAIDFSFFDMNIDGKIDILHISLNLGWYGNLIEDNLSVLEQTITNTKIYPNPANNLMTIESRNSMKSITIYDFNGRKLKTIAPKNSNFIKQIRIGDLSQGVYFIKVIDESGRIETHKLLKK